MDTTYSTYSTSSAVDSAGSVAGLAFAGVIWLFDLVIIVLMLIGMWKLYAKAGKPGWASIVPIYNAVVMCEIAGRPTWWVVLLFIPFVNFIIMILLTIDFVKAYGKGTGFAVLAVLLPFVAYLIMAFDKETRYVRAGGPVAGGANGTSAAPVAPVTPAMQPPQQYAQVPVAPYTQPQPPVQPQQPVQPESPVQPPTPPQFS